MRPYEAMIILRPEIAADGEEAVDSFLEGLGKLINENEGEVESAEKWGKKRLAYEVGDLTEGYYIVLYFKGVRATTDELDRNLKLNETVVRHLLVSRDED